MKNTSMYLLLGFALICIASCSNKTTYGVKLDEETSPKYVIIQLASTPSTENDVLWINTLSPAEKIAIILAITILLIIILAGICYHGCGLFNITSCRKTSQPTQSSQTAAQPRNVNDGLDMANYDGNHLRPPPTPGRMQSDGNYDNHGNLENQRRPSSPGRLQSTSNYGNLGNPGNQGAPQIVIYNMPSTMPPGTMPPTMPPPIPPGTMPPPMPPGSMPPGSMPPPMMPPPMMPPPSPLPYHHLSAFPVRPSVSSCYSLGQECIDPPEYTPSDRPMASAPPGDVFLDVPPKDFVYSSSA